MDNQYLGMLSPNLASVVYLPSVKNFKHRRFLFAHTKFYNP